MVDVNGVTVAWIEAGTEITTAVIFACVLTFLVLKVLNRLI
jgi:hypothetical protein